MALIKCPHCGKTVSNLAEKCPHCGYILKGNAAEENSKSEDIPAEEPFDEGNFEEENISNKEESQRKEKAEDVPEDKTLEKEQGSQENFRQTYPGKERSNNTDEIRRLKKTRNILIGALCAAVAGIIGIAGYGASTVSDLRIELAGARAEASVSQSKYDTANKKLKAAQADTDSVQEELEGVQSEYDAYKEKMAPYEKMTAAQAEQQTAAAEAAKQETANQNAANEAVNKLWDDKTGLKDGATRAEYNDAVDKVNKVGNTAAKSALNEKLKAINDSMTAKEQAAAAEEAAGYETGITYDQLARNPDQYMGKKVKFRGKVVQVIEDSSSDQVEIRLAVNSDYDRILLGSYSSSIVSSRILEDDTITIYGTSAGTITYQSTMGASITIPGVYIDKIDQ